MTSREVVISFRVGQFGDSLVALPALQAVRRRHQNARHVLLTNAPPRAGMVSARSVLEPSGLFDDVIEFEGGWSAKLTLLLELHRLKPDFIYFLHPNRSFRQFARDEIFWALTAPRAEKHGRKGSLIPVAPKGRDGKLLHLQPEYLRLRSLVADAPESELEFPMLKVADGNREKASALLGSWLTNSIPVIGLGVGSKMSAKIWPLERYIQVVQNLSAMRSLRFVVLGGPEDEAAAHSLVQACPDAEVVNVAGSCSIFDSAAILGELDLYLGNDTGTMHLAGVMGCETIALFSARENPGMWEPVGRRTILRKSVPCEGCMAIDCPVVKHPCLTGISVEQVVEAVVNALDRDQ